MTRRAMSRPSPPRPAPRPCPLLRPTLPAVSASLTSSMKALEASPLIPQATATQRSEEHTSELQSRLHLVCRLLLEKKKTPQTKRSEGGQERRRYVTYELINKPP